MTPSARVEAAIELLDVIIPAARGKGAPADRIIADYFRARRYAGSKDRRAIADRVVQMAKASGQRPLGVEGEAQGEWVLVDLPSNARSIKAGEFSSHRRRPVMLNCAMRSRKPAASQRR